MCIVQFFDYYFFLLTTKCSWFCTVGLVCTLSLARSRSLYGSARLNRLFIRLSFAAIAARLRS